MTRHRTPKADQPGLFPDLHSDSRPLGERTAAERHTTPGLLDWIREQRAEPPDAESNDDEGDRT